MSYLYLLSLLLTADESLAEKCFVRGLEDAGKGNPVFKEWALSWARRTTIQKAIEIVQPRPNSAAAQAAPPTVEPPEIAAVVDLPAFERVVFVISVLERNSDQECSLLLECTRGEVAAARTRALQQLGSLAQRHSESVARSLGRRTVPDHPGSALHLQVISSLPVST